MLASLAAHERGTECPAKRSKNNLIGWEARVVVGGVSMLDCRLASDVFDDVDALGTEVVDGNGGSKLASVMVALV